MALAGFQGTIDEGQWSSFQWRHGEIAFRHGVWSGGVTSVGVGTRAVDVSAIDCIIAGILFTNSVVTTVTLGANGTSNPRIDMIVAEENWTTKTVTIKAVQGTAAVNPVPPSLSLGAGSLWQMQLARVRVPAGATTIAAANIEVCKPLPRKPIIYRLTPQIDTITGTSTTWRGLGIVSVEDPGWAYHVDLGASVRFTATATSGYMRIRIVDADGSAVYGEAISPTTKSIDAGTGKSPAVLAGQITPLISGSKRFQLQMLGAEYTGTEQVSVLDHPSNHITLVIRPA